MSVAIAVVPELLSREGNGMLKRSVVAYGLVGLVVTLVGCGSSGRDNLRAEGWATITSQQEQVVALQTQVGAIEAIVRPSSPQPAEMDFARVWAVEVASIERAAEFPRLTPSESGRTTVVAHGVFVVVRMNVVNVSTQPMDSFAWWDLRLEDTTGRTFSPNEQATESYVTTKSDIRENQPDEFQPGLTYQQAVVFDAPVDQVQFTLGSDDGTLMVPLTVPMPGATPTS